MSEELEQKAPALAPDSNPDMDKAVSDGWRPKEEWSGDDSQWIDYGEFNYRGELMGRISEQSNIIHNQKSQIDEVKSALTDLRGMQDKIAEGEYKKIVKMLRNQKAVAIEEGNGAAVSEIEEQIDTLKESREASQQPGTAGDPEVNAQPPLDPQVQAWVTAPQNQWYNSNAVMRHTANAIAADFAKANPSWTPGQVIAQMDKEMRKEMPHKFANSPVGNGDLGNRPNSGGHKKNRGMKDLSEDEQSAAKRFIKLGVFKDVSEYIEQLDAIGE